jgi:SAM-dependent methyltransferase
MATTYMHGYAVSEQERLSRLNELLNGSALREIRVLSGERVIDFGAGLGQLTRAMGRAAGCPVVAIELGAEQARRGRELAAEAGESGLIDYRVGRVEEPPLAPEEWGAFDLAHARFLLEHASDPLAVVRQMVRAVRPGGRIVLQDDDHDTLRLWPEPPGFAGLWHAYVRAAGRNGTDPYVGRRLVSLLVRAGGVPRRSSMIFFGGCGGSPELETMVSNVTDLFAGVREAMQRDSAIEPHDYEEAIAAFRRWGARPDAAFWYAVPWVEGRRA